MAEDAAAANEPKPTTPETAAAEEKPKQSKEERKMEQKMIKVISRMNENVTKRFQTLYCLSDERSKINDLFEAEIKELSDRFEKRKLPILARRDKILAGEETAFDDMCITFDESQKKLETAVAGIVKTDEEKEADEEEAKAHKPTNVDHLKDKNGVPDFWGMAIKNHAMLQQIVSDKDKPVLEHLTKLHCEQAKVPFPKLTVTMQFSENEWFTNTELKFVALASEESDQTVEIQGTEIDWKEGKDTTKDKIKKTQKNKKTGEKRVIVKTVPKDSFFNIFESKKEPEGIHEQDEDDLDSDDDKLMQQLEEAHDIANDLYDLYTTDGLEYYLNFGPDLEGMGLEGDGDSDDDSDEDDKPKKGGKKGGPEAGPKIGPDGKPEDCKQQ